jgi:hypothetical protein
MQVQPGNANTTGDVGMQISTAPSIVDVYLLIRIEGKAAFRRSESTALLLSTGIARLVTPLSSRRMRQHGKLSWYT